MSLVAFLVTIAAAGPVPEDPRQALETAIAVIEHQEGLIATWTIEYRHTSSAGAFGDTAGTGESLHREVRSGARFRKSYQGKTVSGRKDRDVVESRTEESYDGKQARKMTADGRATVNSQSMADDITYFRWIYGLKNPLSEILRSVAPEEVTWEEVEGRRLLRCRVSIPPHSLERLANIYWLDPEESWQPRQVRCDYVAEPMEYPDGRRGSVLTNRVRRFIHEEGVVMPADTERTVEKINRDGVRALDMKERFTLTSLEVNPEVEEGFFTLPFLKGTKVIDVERRLSYVEGEPGSEAPLETPRRTGPALAADGGLWNRWGDRRVWWSVAGLLLALLAGIRWKEWKARVNSG